MSSQETDHVSPTEVTPELGKGALDTWRPSRSVEAAGLIKPALTQMTAREARLWANQAWQGCTRTSV
jgi:hypothetical protein